MPPIELVPDPVVRREFHITAMATWRWDRDPRMIAIGWPPPIRIGKRVYRQRDLLEAFKVARIRQSERPTLGTAS